MWMTGLLLIVAETVFVDCETYMMHQPWSLLVPLSSCTEHSAVLVPSSCHDGVLNRCQERFSCRLPCSCADCHIITY